MNKFNPENLSISYDKWLLPDIERELGEIERTAKTFSPLGFTEMQMRILNALDKGEAMDLTDDIWSQLENTDSWDITPGQMESVLYHTDHSGRDPIRIENAIRDSTPLPMPIIIIQEDGTPYKIAGNTRLMVARALGITPKVFVARL